MGVIPNFIKIRVKGKSLSGVIGPRRVPITRWVCKGILLGVDLGTSLDPYLRALQGEKGT